MDRGTRRARTERVAQRRFRLYQRIMHVPDESTPERQRTSHRYAKTASMACHCAKRRYGCPRLDVGMCWIGLRDRIYEWRAADRELRALVRRGWRDWEDDSVSLLEDNAFPRYYHDYFGALDFS